MSETLVNIAIIGAGNLGRRHLQSLVLLESPRHFFIIDPFDKSLAEAEKLAEATDKNATHQYSYTNTIDSLPNNIDFAVLATNSNERFEALQQLLTKVRVRFLVLEKVLFPRMEEYQEAKNLLQKNEVTAWVNCPRRMFPEFNKMRQYFHTKEPSVFTATGNMWQLGCNGIHTYDLFAFLTGDTDVQFKTDMLDPKVLPSKRNGYVEFTGTLYGKSGRGNFIQMTSSANSESRMPAVYTIANASAHFIIHRGVEAHYDYALAEEKWTWKRGAIKSPFQSELTQLIVQQIESGAEPGLTSFDESAKLHQQLIQAFISHLDAVKFQHRPGECMIT